MVSKESVSDTAFMDEYKTSLCQPCELLSFPFFEPRIPLYTIMGTNAVELLV